MDWRVFIGVLGTASAFVGLRNGSTVAFWFSALVAAFAFGAAA